MNIWLMDKTFEAVCQTFESNPSESEALIEQFLIRDDPNNYEIVESHVLAEKIKKLIPLSPKLISKIYCRVFENREKQKKGVIEGGKIESYRISRQVRIESNQYGLGLIYKDFLLNSLDEATKSLITIVEKYDELLPDRLDITFDFNGQVAKLKHWYYENADLYEIDYSKDNKLPEQAKTLLGIFKDYLEELYKQGNFAKYKQVVDLIIQNNSSPIIWKQLLVLGTRHPESLGKGIKQLAWTIPMLTSTDLSRVVGDFLKTAFATFDEADREKIEAAILCIPTILKIKAEDSLNTTNNKNAKFMRNRLLGCLPPDYLVSKEAIKLYKQVRKNEYIPDNHPPNGVWGTNLPTSFDTSKETSNVRKLSNPVNNFINVSRNKDLNVKESEGILPNLRELYNELKLQKVDTSSDSHMGWHVLAEACARVSNCLPVDGKESLKFLECVLFEAAFHPTPMYNPSQDDHSAFYSTPAVRVCAAKGIIKLIEHFKLTDQKWFDVLEQLSKDDVAAVRLTVAENLFRLYQNEVSILVMWSRCEHFSKQENNDFVLSGLVRTLEQLQWRYSDQVVPLVSSIFNRIKDKERTSNKDFHAPNHCINIFVDLYLVKDNATCNAELQFIAQNPDRHVNHIIHIAYYLRECIITKAAEVEENLYFKISKSVFNLLTIIIKNTYETFEDLNKEPNSTNKKDSEEQIQQLLKIFNYISKELYFMSGAYKPISSSSEPRKFPTTEKERKTFFSQAKPVIDILSNVGDSAISHKLVEILDHYVDCHPEHVLIQLKIIILNTKVDGYQDEASAMSLTISLIEKFLTQYKYILQTNRECREAILQILDVFVDSGWKDAQILAYNLENVFR